MNIFQNKSINDNSQREIAIILGKVCHHIHPNIVSKIIESNKEFREDILNILENKINPEIFFFDGSDCVFPCTRRNINNEKIKGWKNNINAKGDLFILNDNTFPRNIWTFLAINKPYSSSSWKKSGLNDFEVAHILGHKVDEIALEKEVIKNFNNNTPPYAYFTSASNTVLLPQGFMKPTDKLKDVRIAFFKRHLCLYGGNLEIDNTKIPSWYKDIVWNEPLLVDGWEDKINALLTYRKKYLTDKYRKHFQKLRAIHNE